MNAYSAINAVRYAIGERAERSAAASGKDSPPVYKTALELYERDVAMKGGRINLGQVREFIRSRQALEACEAENSGLVLDLDSVSACLDPRCKPCEGCHEDGCLHDEVFGCFADWQYCEGCGQPHVCADWCGTDERPEWARL